MRGFLRRGRLTGWLAAMVPACRLHYMPRMQAIDWDDLTRELDLWADARRVAALWWRDDDAAEPGRPLSRLLDLASTHEVELGLAVIPMAATEALAPALAGHNHVAVLQHGYRHQNHAPAGAPAVECGGARPVDAVLAELSDGYRRLRQLLAPHLEPVLAAPWNRIDPPVLARLGEAGFAGASAVGPRRAMAGARGLAIANVHVDPLNWKDGGRFAGLSKALSALTGELSARRTGVVEAAEPLGLLTHHLVHDSATWAFLDRLFGLVAAHPAARWRGAREVFGLHHAPRAAAAEAGR